MPYRRARMILLGLLIVFPLLVRAASAPSSSSWQEGVWPQGAPILYVELLLLGGLLVADWNRRRLLSESLRRLDRARTRPVPSRMSEARTRPSIHV
jgi:hypothetical protein